MIFHKWHGWLGKLMLLTLLARTDVWAQAGPNSKLVEAAKKEGEVVYLHDYDSRSEQVGGRPF